MLATFLAITGCCYVALTLPTGTASSPTSRRPSDTYRDARRRQWGNIRARAVRRLMCIQTLAAMMAEQAVMIAAQSALPKREG